MVIDTYTASVLAHGSMYYQVGTVAAQVHQWIAGLEKATEPKKGYSASLTLQLAPTELKIPHCNPCCNSEVQK